MSHQSESQLNILRSQIESHLEQKHLEEALTKAGEAMELAKNLYGEDSNIFEEMMGMVADIHRRAGNPGRALPLYLLLLKRVSTKGEIRLEYIFALRVVVEVCLDAGNTEEASKWLAELRRVAPAVVALDARGADYVIRFLNDIAVMWGNRGQSGVARELLEDALDLAISYFGAGSEPHLQCLNNLTSQLVDDNELETAEKMYGEVIDSLEAMHGPHHPYIAMTLGSLASLNSNRGNMELAQKQLEQALDIFDKCGESNSPSAARSLLSLAELHAEASRYGLAGKLSDRALRILKAGLEPHDPEIGEALHKIGRIEQALGDLDGAYARFEQALEIFGKAYGEDSPPVTSVLNNMVNVNLERFRYDLAVQNARRVVEAHLRLQHQQSREYIMALSNLASALLGLGDHEDAAQVYEECLAQLKSAGRELTRDYATVLNNLGLLNNDRGDCEAAEAYHRTALEIRKQRCDVGHPFIFQSMNNLALVLAATGRLNEALDLKLRVETFADDEIGAVFTAGSERQRLTVHERFRGQLYSFLSLVRMFRPESPKAIRNALDLVLRRKGVGAEALWAQRDAVLSGRYPGLKLKLQELGQLRQDIASAALAAAQDGGGTLDKHQLERREALERELARSIPEMNLADKLRTANHEVLADALPRDSALLEFVRCGDYDYAARPLLGENRWGTERYLVFVLLAGAPEQVQMLDLGEAEPIDALIAHYRASVDIGGRELQPVNPAKKEQKGQELRTAIFDPLVAALDGRTRLFIAPDGNLTRVNWSALPDTCGACLIESFHISYLCTGRDLLRQKLVTELQAGPSLVLGDPDYDLVAAAGSAKVECTSNQSRAMTRSGLRFDRLPGTLGEAREIAKILGARPLLGAEALERRVKEAYSPLVLHFATHGFFLPDARGDTRLSHVENPLLRSGLALAGANTWLKGGVLPAEAEDALLNAEDVVCMDLLATELVVLSACDTGLGAVHVGEGVFGLQRAFLEAGASTLIMSLWRVPDEDTRSLMIDFYNGLTNGLPKDEALREAQLKKYRAHPNEPGRWGAFISLGDCRPFAGF